MLRRASPEKQAEKKGRSLSKPGWTVTEKE